ncbi:MAG: transcriptional regulator [Flavobacteriaceae bacterium CG18_big_fil_WC_8_21_14_2_50_34_36]|jgi:putative transcriptional regulator|nr:MAG: transcriptional regulator [Flavobacteriaceae bacterium CG18_big_fil_WC_8_21_14_2_50_34_36]
MKNKVKNVRKEKGLTQKELAEILNVSRQTIISIEAKRYVPSTILSLKIAYYFGKSVEELFELEEIELI